MRNKIQFIKYNDRDWTSLEWIQEFFDFLQGEMPENVQISRGHAPKMSPKKAMSVIWYLQEHMPVIPDTIERCDNCGGLFDYDESGLYWESKGKYFCDGCNRVGRMKGSAELAALFTFILKIIYYVPRTLDYLSTSVF